MNFDETIEFRKDVKTLKKRVPTLRDDLKRAKIRIESLYVLGDDMSEADLTEFRAQFFSGKIATILPGSTNDIEIVKVRLDSDTDQFRSKLRLVFTAIRTKNEILFVELYLKNDKSREDISRIKKYI